MYDQLNSIHDILIYCHLILLMLSFCLCCTIVMFGYLLQLIYYAGLLLLELFFICITLLRIVHFGKNFSSIVRVRVE